MTAGVVLQAPVLNCRPTLPTPQGRGRGGWPRGRGGVGGAPRLKGIPDQPQASPRPSEVGRGGREQGRRGGGIGIGKLGNFLVDVEALLQPSGLARSGPSFRRAEERAQHRGAKERKIGSEGAFGDRPRKVFSPKGGD